MLSTLREVNHEMQRYSSRQLMMLIQKSLLSVPKMEPEIESEVNTISEKEPDIKLEMIDTF